MIAKSPERHTFQDKPDASPEVKKMWAQIREDDEHKFDDLEARVDNLEYDLRSTEWVVNKAREREGYAQNIYAAMCNMRWQRVDVLPILKDQYWSCSWRSAGGIVADLVGKGDYIDWYCSGIRNSMLEDEGEITNYDRDGFVPEGVITDEIREDFYKLGWQPSAWPDDDK